MMTELPRDLSTHTQVFAVNNQQQPIDGLTFQWWLLPCW